VRSVPSDIEGVPKITATLLQGSGLRLLECCRLRVKDVDFARNRITVRRGKGDKDRATMLPAMVKAALAASGRGSGLPIMSTPRRANRRATVGRAAVTWLSLHNGDWLISR
jgi:integrase